MVETEDFKIPGLGAACGTDCVRPVSPWRSGTWQHLGQTWATEAIEEHFGRCQQAWPLSQFGFNMAWWCDEKRLFILLSLLFYTPCLSLLMHNLPILLMVRGKVVVIIIITSENPYFFWDLSLIDIAFHLKCNTFTFSLYIHLELNLLLVWFEKDSKVISRAQKFCASVRKQL